MNEPEEKISSRKREESFYMANDGQNHIATPASTTKRIGELDLIRGMALLGILIANMQIFSYPYLYTSIIDAGWWQNAWDQTALWFIYLFVEQKFFTIFSFLFGLGFMIFLQRAKHKTDRPIRLYVRRLLFLFVLGLIHTYLIWSGDILLPYALLGFLLIFFYHKSAKTMLTWAVGLLVASCLFMIIQTFLFDNFMAARAPSVLVIENLIQDSVHAYSQGTYMDMLIQRLLDSDFGMEFNIFMMPMILAMFLFGAYAGKKELFRNLNQHRTGIKKMWRWSFIIGTVFLIVQVVLRTQVDAQNSGYNMAHIIGVLISAPALCFFYITSVLLLLQRDIWQRLLRPLKAVGRMALTNYLLQTVVCTLIFYSYGFGMYGKLGPALGVVLAFIIFGIQIIASNLWLKHFKFGPMEWIWRSFTYKGVFAKTLEKED
ncbi:DUF418 domain-containing protein [Oceanobacillus jeddahense]|uniref:DUF418 domain-containing protein n=1 Tax=Oceanobacillus jeddahense TaxID=1462527 RepID=A0ABY5JL75_9BACI|nr:DUF418 domain-containing protein [Oceanobacillus jeddahense]UUI01052.1 DUF418 domain-containing protein [Oceanobacillus jeddahense]